MLPMSRTATPLAVIAALVAPLGAQEFIEIPAEDRYLEADFEELFRVGTTIGGTWESFTTMAKLAFDEGG